MLRSGKLATGGLRRWSLRSREEVDVQGIITSLKQAPAPQNSNHRPPSRNKDRGVMATDTIKSDADAAFYIKCRFLGRTSRWMTYTGTVDLRNQLYKLLARFRRSGLAGEEVYTASILFFTCLGMGHRAHAVFDMALEDGIRPNSRMYNFLLGAYANEGKWTMTCQLWTQMVRNDILPTPHSFNILLRAQQKSGNKLEVFELMHLMSDIMKPNSMTWTILLAACTSYEESMLVLNDMRKHDLLPDNRTVGAVLDACVLSGDVNHAEQIARRAEREWGVPFTTGTYNVLMNVYKEISDFEGVKECFKRMQLAGCRPDTLSYNLLVTTSALSGEVHTGRTAFMEAETLGISRTLHMNTSITAVFGYVGDHENAQRCWESRPGRGPAAKRTEPQLANIRECYIAARLLSYKHRTTGLMAELYRLRDPALIGSTNPYIIQCFLRQCIALKGWGVIPIWRIMCQVRTPKKAAKSVDTRRYQAVLHVSIDKLLATAILLWIKDHNHVTIEQWRAAENNPWEQTGMQYLDLIEDVFARAYNRGPSMAASFIEQLLACYSVLGMVERAKVRYGKLLKGGASHRSMYPHAKSMRDIYELSGKEYSEHVILCNNVITQFHTSQIWRRPCAEVLKTLAEDGARPSDETFAAVREKQTRVQAAVRRKQRETEMIVKTVPGQNSSDEDYLIGIASDQLPFITAKLNEIEAPPKGKPETMDGNLERYYTEELAGDGVSSMRDPDGEEYNVPGM